MEIMDYFSTEGINQVRLFGVMQAEGNTQLAGLLTRLSEGAQSQGQSARVDAIKTDMMSTLENKGFRDTLNRQLAQNPGLGDKIISLAQNNPQALQGAWAQIKANPNNAAVVVNGIGARPAVAFAQAAQPAAASPAAASPAAAQPAAAQPAAVTINDILFGPDGQMRPGVEGFMQNVNNNPKLKQAFSELMEGEGADPQKQQEFLTALKAKLDKNPNFFEDINKIIRERPGLVDTFAETFANDPGRAMDMADQFMEMNNTFGQIGTMLERFLGPEAAGQIMDLLGGLMEMLMPLMGSLNGLFGGSEATTVQSSNPANSPATHAQVTVNPGVPLDVLGPDGKKIATVAAPAADQQQQPQVTIAP